MEFELSCLFTFGAHLPRENGQQRRSCLCYIDLGKHPPANILQFTYSFFLCYSFVVPDIYAKSHFSHSPHKHRSNRELVSYEIKSTTQKGCEDTRRFNHSVCVMSISFYGHTNTDLFSHDFSWLRLESVSTFDPS